ncbi:MAG: hypothetical protein M1833_004140 [Piccolia ochrophora]|nr:MAG: hypothetical protein M1833_004140 [Piccolia ochrophora]
MPPTENTLLTSFLLPPAPLPTFLPLTAFTELFPRAQRSNPQIPILYRELQHQRARAIDQVRRNIAAETKKGEAQRREVVRARRKAEKEEMGEAGEQREIMMESELFGPTTNLPTNETHTLRSILPELESACSNVESEIQELDAEAEEVLADLQSTIGDLSDLRYGRFNKPQGDFRQDVLDGLRRLEEVSKQAQKS